MTHVPSPRTKTARAGKYVVVTGAIAAGASTLAEDLAARLGWQTLLEGPVETDNGFFGRAAADFRRWGLASQAHFLLASVDRHRALAERLQAADTVIVEDRSPFEHTGVYLAAHEATGALPADEIDLLRRLAAAVEHEYLVPDLFIYRRLGPTQLRTRVAERGRPGEEALRLAHLEAVHAQFDAFADAWTRSPVMIVPASADVRDPAQAAPLAEEARRALAAATSAATASGTG